METILKKDYTKVPPQLNLLRIIFLKKYAINTSSENNNAFLIKKLTECLFSQTIYKKELIILKREMLGKNTDLKELKYLLEYVFPEDTQYNLLLLFYAHLKNDHGKTLNSLLSKCAEIKLPSNKKVPYSFGEYELLPEDNSTPLDHLVILLHNILLDSLLLIDYKHGNTKDADNINFAEYKKELQKIIKTPSLSRYSFLNNKHNIDNTRFKTYADKILYQLEMALRTDYEIFPALVTLCINRTAQKLRYIKNDNKLPSNFKRKYKISISDCIEYLSAIIAPEVTVKNKKIIVKSRNRLKEYEYTHFIKHCTKEHRLFIDSPHTASDKRILLYLCCEEYAETKYSHKLYSDIKPLIVLCKSEIPFSLNYNYFNSFIETCKLSVDFNAPLSLLHLNMCTHWIDACFLTKGFPYTDTTYEGLYIKNLYCDKYYSDYVMSFLKSNLFSQIIEKINNFNTAHYDNDIIQQFKEYYLSSTESTKLINILNNDSLPNDDEDVPFYKEFLENYLERNMRSNPSIKTYRTTPIYDWILSLENKDDYNQLMSLCKRHSIISLNEPNLQDALNAYYNNKDILLKLSKCDNFLEHFKPDKLHLCYKK